jgi:hypothetical protein
MELSGYFHAPVALPLKINPIPIDVWKKRKSLARSGIPNSTVSSP